MHEQSHNVYSTLFKMQERNQIEEAKKYIEQRMESQNTHIKQGRTCDLIALTSSLNGLEKYIFKYLIKNLFKKLVSLIGLEK